MEKIILKLHMATQERINIDWITNVKAISIILVYLSHMPSFFGGSLGLFNSLIEPFYVNAFFFVSGYLLFWKHLSSPSINETTKSFITNGRGRRTLDGLLFKIAIPSIFFAAVMYVPKKIIKGGVLSYYRL